MSAALTAWREQIATWWRGLSSRERWLVGTLAALLAGLMLIFAIVKPLQAARAQAIADIRSYETLTARVRAAGTLNPGAAQVRMRPGAPIEAAQAAAQDAGVAAILTPDGAGVTAQVADAPYAAVIAWIADVERTTPLRVRRVELLKGGAAGRVRATLAFAP